MTTTDAQLSTSPLRTLYLTRFGFAIAWAVLLFLSSTMLDTAPRRAR